MASKGCLLYGFQLFVWLTLFGGIFAAIPRLIAALFSLLFFSPTYAKNHLLFAKYLLNPINKTIVWTGHRDQTYWQHGCIVFQVIISLPCIVIMIPFSIICFLLSFGTMIKYYWYIIRIGGGLSIEYYNQVIDEQDFHKHKFHHRLYEFQQKSTKNRPYTFNEKDFRDIIDYQTTQKPQTKQSDVHQINVRPDPTPEQKLDALKNDKLAKEMDNWLANTPKLKQNNSDDKVVQKKQRQSSVYIVFIYIHLTQIFSLCECICVNRK